MLKDRPRSGSKTQREKAAVLCAPPLRYALDLSRSIRNPAWLAEKSAIRTLHDRQAVTAKILSVHGALNRLPGLSFDNNLWAKDDGGA